MRCRHFALAVLLAATGSASAFAGWDEWWAGYKTDFRRAHDWPHPFNCADRMAAAQPFEIMKENGWRRENTVGNELFDIETNELLVAGMHKVRWTVTQAPIHRRTVWVLRGETPQATAIRVDSVQSYVQRLIQEGPLPEVLVTDTPPGGTSGDYLDAIDRSMRSSVPAPRLPAMPTDSE